MLQEISQKLSRTSTVTRDHQACIHSVTCFEVNWTSVIRAALLVVIASHVKTFLTVATDEVLLRTARNACHGSEEIKQRLKAAGG